MLRDSEHPDPPTSLLCFILFNGYLLMRGSNTSCPCFALRSFLIKHPSTFQNFFIFTLLPGSSVLLQTPNVQNTILLHKVIALSLPGSNYLEPTPCFCPSLFTCQFFRIFLANLSFQKRFLQSYCPEMRARVCVSV